MKSFALMITVAMAVLIGSSCSVDADKPSVSTREAAPHGAKSLWLTSLEDAKQEAAKRNVPILADFSGSDWCGWCIKLDAEVFSKPEFKEYASQNLVLLLLDFPRRKPLAQSIARQNEKMARDFNVEGFPTVLILDAQGKEVARTGYRPGGAAEYVNHLKSVIKPK